MLGGCLRPARDDVHDGDHEGAHHEPGKRGRQGVDEPPEDTTDAGQAATSDLAAVTRFAPEATAPGVVR